VTARRKALSVTAMAMLIAGGAAAWALAPARVSANTRTATATVAEAPRLDPWAKGPIDRDYMVKGVLDYRSDGARR
jgi:hypothetical protein